jgi:MGT family glycosyltransferase
MTNSIGRGVKFRVDSVRSLYRPSPDFDVDFANNPLFARFLGKAKIKIIVLKIHSDRNGIDTMSKIVYISAPAHGHVNPTLPVVKELIARGEEVIYYNTEEFRSKIESTGAIFRPYPETALTSTAISTVLESGNLANVTVLLLSVTEPLTTFLLDRLPDENADLIVFDSLAIWGKIAANRLGIRAAGSITHFIFDIATADMTLREIFKMLVQHLPKVPGLLTQRRRLARRFGAAFPRNTPLFPMRDKMNIVFTTRELHPPNRIIDDSYHFVGPSLHPESTHLPFPFDLPKGEVVVYLSLGTVHDAPITFYQDCFRTFANFPAQFIVSVGQRTNIVSLGSIPTNFIVRSSVPQLAVLQHTDVFITHGGMNSIHESLYYGVPMVMIPHQVEQLFNSRIVAKQGAAVVLDEQLQKHHITADHLRIALEQVLANPSYCTAAQNLQTTLHDTGGYRQAADIIQSYLTISNKKDNAVSVI